MQQKNALGDILFMAALILFAVVLVDERWIRTAVALVPVLLLAQRALNGPPAAPLATGAAERREDPEVRTHIEELLKHFREFYTTCHLMAGGKLEPEEARDLAGGIERRLNELLAEVTEGARASAEPRA